MQHYDVVIVGASFAGLTLARHLPASLRVLVVDAKPAAGSSVESTGLITTKTYESYKTFFPIDDYITNPISAICVVAPNFKDYFVSETKEPWIYQTDTKGLVAAMAEGIGEHVTVQTKTVFIAARDEDGKTIAKLQTQGEDAREVSCGVLVGADGSHSKVAQVTEGLDKNKNFLFGYERVYFGDVTLGPNPAETIYHYWFGDFSLGYGGWLSPTIVDGKSAFRIGLAKLMKERGKANELLHKFTERLLANGTITIEGSIDKPDYSFGSLIPIGGVVKRVVAKNRLLIGDAAGYCGAFAADGIKGSLLSGKIAAELIPRYLEGDTTALDELHLRMNDSGMIDYYRRQTRYRWIWDQMRRNKTFRAMFNIIEQEKETFVDQFCDSKDTRRSLSWTVLKVKYVPKLISYSLRMLADILFRPKNT